MDCSLPGSSIHGIFQARVLEWGAIAFSESLEQPLPNNAETLVCGSPWNVKEDLSHQEKAGAKGTEPPGEAAESRRWSGGPSVAPRRPLSAGGAERTTGGDSGDWTGQQDPPPGSRNTVIQRD